MMKPTRRDFVVSAILGGTALALEPAANAAGASAANPPASERPEDERRAAGPEELDSVKFRAAATRGDTAAVAAYLERDPGLLYARDAKDVSVFRLALLAGQAGVAELLRTRGLVLDVFDAATAGDEARIAELYREDPGAVHSRTRYEITALTYAAQGGRQAIVEFLLGRGADPNANVLDPKGGAPLGVTPLRTALEYPQKEAAEKMAMWMLGNGADPNAAQVDGRSPLHAAAIAGYDRAVRMLLRKGAEPGAKDAEGRTALQLASTRPGNAAAEILRSPESVARDLYTSRYSPGPGAGPEPPLETDGIPQDFVNRFVTVCHFDPARTRKLYTLCPALLSTRSTWNEMGIEGAAHVGTEPCADFLLEKGAPLSICTATMMGMTARVNELLREDARRSAERGAHDFPLLLFTTFGQERAEIAEILLKAGADPNANMRGITALHLAARKGYVQLAELLLGRGADPNLPADYPFLAEGTALAVATKFGRNDVAALVRARGGKME
jgi:uncharacterized protein